MRTIGVVSDLHLEFGSEPYVELPDTDILVMAGDITVAAHLDPKRTDPTARRSRRGFHRLMDRIHRTPYELVLGIAGNHESYHGDLDETPEIMREVYREFGVTFLHNQILETADWRFVGGTLWTDFNNSPMDMMRAQQGINDYRAITAGSDPLTPSRTAAEHEKTMWVIGEFLSAEPDHRGRCVITHHLPSWRSISSQYQASPLNSAYASKLDDTVEQADLWLHGHTHNHCDYNIGQCRVVCNPLGYNGHEPIGLEKISIGAVHRLNHG
jgi:predicted phosphodiesterase